MRIMIGILCFQNAPAETLEDYMRFAYHLGRRSGHEYILGIKSKSEQFRARNAIVEQALKTGCDYLLMLDDDHVINWEVTTGPTSQYGFVDKFLEYFEKDEKLGIVGALYYQRGDTCRPVLMRQGKDGAFYWLRDDEITGELQSVDVQGGGCMLLRMKMFDRIKSPWFVPEQGQEVDMGTDLQICKKAISAGYKVACDTSVQIGHVMSKREIITSKNRHKIAAENAQHQAGGDDGIDQQWAINSALNLYRLDAEEYLDMKFEEMAEFSRGYEMTGIENCKTPQDYENYYRSLGKEQLARQVMFHHTTAMRNQMGFIFQQINMAADAYGVDVGCGSAPVSFEICMKGHRMDFIDVDGSAAYEFTKWRANKRHVSAGFKLEGPYDYALFLDSIEHMPNWKDILGEVISHLTPKGAIITNFFLNEDYFNKEHVNMDKDGVKAFLLENEIYPINDMLWAKQNLRHTRKEAV